MVKSVHKRAIPPGEAGADSLSLPPSGTVPTAAWFSALLESAPDAIVIVDDTGQIVLVNSRSEELFGYDRAKATELMLDVHHKGRAVVSSGTREKAELDVFRLHEHGLWATMRQD